jgi:hypothetical protein
MKKILEQLNLPADATEEQIVEVIASLKETIFGQERANAELQEELAEATKAAKGAAINPLVKAKMAAGLSRAQAEEVVKFQAEADAAEKKARK